MTTQAEAIEAARIYKASQPAIDALRDTMAANSAAKKILGAYMSERKLSVFRGVTLKIVPFETWDSLSLRAYLGNKVSKFRTKQDRKYFGLAKAHKTKDNWRGGPWVGENGPEILDLDKGSTIPEPRR